MSRSVIGALVSLVGLAVAVPACADEPGARRWIWADASASMNPAGLRLRVGGSARRALPEGDGPLLRGRELKVGVTLASTPAYGALGVEATAVPVAFLELGARYQLVGFYGAYGSLWRLPSRRSSFGEAEVRHAHATPGLGNALTTSAALRARIGGVVVQNELAATFLQLGRARGWFYFPEESTLVATRDVLLIDQLVALTTPWQGEGEAGLRAGPWAELTRSVRADLTRLRVGAVASWIPADRLGSLRRPRIGLVVAAVLRDPARRGRVFAGLSVGGDLEAGPGAP